MTAKKTSQQKREDDIARFKVKYPDIAIKEMPDALKVANPDCEPATKAYVKHIARTLVKSQCNHVFYKNVPELAVSAISAMILALLWACAMVAGSHPEMAWACGVGAVVSASVAFDAAFPPKIEAEIREPVDEIKKYKSKECE